MVIEVAGKEPVGFAYPLAYGDRQHLRDTIAAKGGMQRVALEEISNTRREMTVSDAMVRARDVIEARDDIDQVELLALIQANYRLGQFDLCTHLLRNAG